MSKGVKIALILGGVSALLAGAYIYYTKNLAKLVDITYRFQNFQLIKASFKEFILGGEIVLTNPSDLKFTITGYDINVQYKDKNIVNLKKDDANIPILANQNATIPFTVQFNPADLGSTLLPLFLADFVNKTAGSTTSFRYIGSVSVKYGIIHAKNIPVDYTYTF